MTTIQGEISQAARQQANRISAAEALDRAVDLVSQKRGLGLEARQDLASAAKSETLGYGVLQPYFDDSTIEEIWINRPNELFVSRAGLSERIFLSLSAEDISSLVERMLDQAREAFADFQHAANRDALMGKLTARESQVLERIVAGRLNKQIADDLGISIKTVEAHRANIMEKLNANTVADLLKIALGPNSTKA